MIATGIVALWNVAKCLSKSTQNDSDNCRSDKYKGIMRYTRYDIIDKANQEIEPWPIQIRIHSAYVLLTFPLRFQIITEAVICNHVFQKHDQLCNNGFIEIIIWKHAFEKQTHATSQAMNNQCSRSITNTNTVRSMLTESVVWKHVFEKHGQPCKNGIIQINIWKHALEKTTHATSHAMKQYSITMQLLKHTIAFFFSTLIPLLLTHLRSQAHCPS